jgi:hypothetical protein
VLPLQHPFGHDAALQTHWPLALQAWFIPQAVHVAPAVPQDVTDSLA